MKIISRAGGVPTVVAELMRHNMLPHPDAITANGKSIGDNCREQRNLNQMLFLDNALKEKAGFINMKGNLFDSAMMKQASAKLFRTLFK